PHLGHALEKLGADAMARYHRLAGRPVHFVIGMDEHGLNVLQYARTHGLEPQEWVDSIAAQFTAAWQRLGLTNDDFIRTTQPRHARAVEAIIARMSDAGDLYRGVYAGYYCVGCESYKGEDELEPAPDHSGTAGGGEGGPSAPPRHPGGGGGTAGGTCGRGRRRRGRRRGAGAPRRAPDLHAAPHAHAALGRGGELVLPALTLPGAAAEADRGDGLRAAGAAAQRTAARHRRRARRPVRLPGAAAVGDPLAGRPRPHRLRVDRRA